MALRHVLLTALHHNEATGYEITKEFDDVLGFFWQASHQQVYRELGKLTREGLVSYRRIVQTERPDKKQYCLTEKGRESLTEWLSTPAPPPRVNDDLLVKILGAELVGAERLLDEINYHRAHNKERLATFRAIEAKYYQDQPTEEQPLEIRLLYLTLRKGIYLAEAWLAWADEAEALLKSGRIL